MVTPPYLKPGDKVGIVSTARKVSMEELQAAIDCFKSWGLEVALGDNLFKQSNQFAGTDEERVADFQRMLDDESIKAIMCARGGYGTVRIIDKLDFSHFIESPKWICGFSDITVLHSHIHQNFGIETVHSVMPFSIGRIGADTEAVTSLKKVLFGEEITYQFPGHELNRVGDVSGILVGGNLSILYSLLGSASDLDTTDKILFIEDLDEYLYHVDRMMQNMKRNGKLSALKALVVGGMSDMRDNPIGFGKSAIEIVADTVKEYDYPVCFNAPAGHIDDNRSLIMGGEISLRVQEHESELAFNSFT